MDLATPSSPNSGSTMCSDRKVSDSEYVDEIVLVSDDSSELRVSFDRLNGGMDAFGIHFVSSKCNLSLQKWFGSKSNVVLVGVQLDEMDRFS